MLLAALDWRRYLFINTDLSVHLKRLPAGTPMYGLERVEGTIQERAAQYVPKLMEIQGTGPYILTGWSLGGALALYA